MSSQLEISFQNIFGIKPLYGVESPYESSKLNQIIEIFEGSYPTETKKVKFFLKVARSVEIKKIEIQ